MKEGYIKQDDRKKILLLTDDIRVHSGVAQMGREIVLNTSHRYNWCQLAGSIQHPDKGQVADISESINKEMGLEDSYCKLYPVDGYGTPDILREIIKKEKVDALFLITDPRYFQWLFNMEEEIRVDIPIAYLNIWDDLPAPQYNEEFYESCDALFGISKQTKFINEIVLGEKANDKIIRYIPHGLDANKFYPLTDNPLPKEKDFTLFFNSRNIRRKAIPDTIAAWKLFVDGLNNNQKQNVEFIIHSDPISQHGTDLPAVIEYIMGEDDTTVKLSTQKVPHQVLNQMYNNADCVIQVSSAEGWGLALTEALLTGTPIIANTTGGMQDQMRFEERGKWYTNNVDLPSNQFGTLKKHGKWALPVFPQAMSIVGSPVTPYIYDSRCDFRDVAERIDEVYRMSSEERQERGKAGMEWALGNEAGFTAEYMGKRVIEGMDSTFENFTPRRRFTFHKDTDFKTRVLNHKLVY